MAGDLAVARGHVDDAPAPLRLHDRHHFLHEDEGRAQVDLEKAGEGRRVQIEGSGNADPGPVEEEINPAPPFLDGPDHSADGGHIGHVGGVYVGSRFRIQMMRRGNLLSRRLKIGAAAGHKLHPVSQ